MAVTALRYRSVDERALKVDDRPQGRLSIVVPGPAKFALDCLAVGIGAEGGWIIAEMAASSWFSHLRHAAQGPSHIDHLLEPAGEPQVLCVALPNQPSQSDVGAACTLGRAGWLQKAFVVATVSQPSPTAMAQLGKAFDCVIKGDGSVHHHWYPSRTIIEPVGGRVICYDLYDVCSLWAGRLGSFGSVDPTTDALHVEVSAQTESLAEVDRLVWLEADKLEDSKRLRLVTVVPGANLGATAVSFSDYGLIRQHRASALQRGENSR